MWAAVDRRRQAVVELLSSLAPEEWDVPSLCDGWTVRDVAAHLTMPLLGLGQLALLALRHPGGTNRLIRGVSIDLARRHDRAELVEQLASLVGRHKPVPGLTCREALIDVVGHTFDIAVPLGREVVVPAEEVAEAADRVVSYGGRGNAKVFRALTLDGLALTATDHPWSTGSGEQVSGTTADLFLLLTGRTARVAHLHGPGADRLRRLVAS